MDISESKSMSGSYSMKGTTPVGVGVKKGSLTTNGNGPPPLSYPADPPDDENMNEIIDENVNLTVVLPDGSQKQQTVESNIPMMDLLINLAASNKLNPAAHSLVVLTGDKWKNIDFKANKTIGLLAGEDRQVSVQIVKKKVEEKVRPKSTAQPFEMTYRFTVNLPHNQKKVLRISPKLTLGEVRQLICKEKNFDQSRYIFLLPGNPNNTLEDGVTVGDLKTSEINFVSIGMIEAASSRSMPNLAFAAARANKDASETRDDSQYMPSAGEKKAKRGFLSFLGKKDKKFKLQHDTEIEVQSRPKKSESFNVGTGRDAESVQARPKTMYDQSGELEHFGLRKSAGDLQTFADKTEFRKSTGSALMAVNENLVLSTKTDDAPSEVASSKQNKRLSGSGAPPKKSAKKRAAPPPPQMNKAQPLTVQVEIDVHSKVPEENRIEIPNERVHSKKNHSRNSSDSSGYHELTVSGAESPDANKNDNLQTTLDTTSIDSAEHFNGDSGIRDMSPVNRRSTSTGAKDSRDSSLDIDKPLATGKKKKRAPLPPPGMTAGTVVTSETKISQPSPTQEGTDTHSKMEKADEFEALQAMEEVTMKFNIEDSDEEGDLRMVENSSIHSEDIDISHRQRPPTFVAPPPPTEPPPEDSEPVDLNMMVNQVDKIDIGVGEDTTSSGPDSAKSSPMSIPRRGSRSSNSSINTLEDLSLAFAQTIEAGEEALGIDSDNDSVQEELKRSMPEFKDNISKLTQDGAESGSPSNRSQTSEQAEDSDQSFIIHETSKDDAADTAVKTPQGNRESSEITYEFTIDAVPADFQNENENESEESFVIEETIILPAAPGILELGSPRKIPDLDSPKEHKMLSLPTHEEIHIDESVPKDSAEDDIRIKDEVETEPVKEEKPPEKEEFVLTFDELSNVDFSAANPHEQRKVRRDSSEVPRVNYRIEFRSSADFDNEAEDLIKAVPATVVNEEPVFNDNIENSNYDNGAKTKCSELSFSPDNEGEAEHMLEEKSISMINLPAERTPVKHPESDNYGAPSETYASSTKIVLSSPQSSSSQVSETSPRKDDSFDSNNLMQAQYNQLQQQFTMWQNQLVQNQKLLASQGASDFPTNQMAGKEDPSSLQLQQLQLQIQMQQQMMLQLQQSMQALALQNTLQTLPQAVNQPLVAMGTLQTQQIPPPPPSTQILTKDNEKYRPPSPEEEMPKGHIKVLTHSEPPAAPVAPPAPAVVTSKPKPSKADAKYSKPKQKRFERELDPREQLMLDIRNFGKKHLHKVPVKATHWHK